MYTSLTFVLYEDAMYVGHIQGLHVLIVYPGAGTSTDRRVTVTRTAHSRVRTKAFRTDSWMRKYDSDNMANLKHSANHIG